MRCAVGRVEADAPSFIGAVLTPPVKLSAGSLPSCSAAAAAQVFMTNHSTSLTICNSLSLFITASSSPFLPSTLPLTPPALSSSASFSLNSRAYSSLSSFAREVTACSSVSSQW